VRVNHPDTGLARAELDAVVQPRLDGLVLPKVEDTATVLQVADWLGAAEDRAGLAPGSIVLVCTLESALGVRNAEAIARAGDRVLALAFGGVDFVHDVRAAPTDDGLETLFARSQLVLSSRVAGRRPPVEGVYTRLHDDPGLERSTRQARQLGFFGRACLHPRQVPTVNSVFTPSEEERAWARSVLAAAEDAERQGRGALRLANGEFVDVAIVRRARAIEQLASALSAQPGL
jgi:citrate lyase subunit beta / citryl-CoA lyase